MQVIISPTEGLLSHLLVGECCRVVAVDLFKAELREVTWLANILPGSLADGIVSTHFTPGKLTHLSESKHTDDKQHGLQVSKQLYLPS